MKSLKFKPASGGTLLATIVAGVSFSAPLLKAQTFTLVDDFESYSVATYSGGSTAFVANAGPWQSNTGGATGLVAIENDGSTNHLAFGWNAGARGGNRTVTAIANGSIGTYYFRIRTSDATPDASFGLSDQPTGALNLFGDFEVQVALTNSVADGIRLGARNGATFVPNLVTGLSANTWYDIWVVVDNTTDTYDVFYGTSGDPNLVGIQIADDFVFRNSGAGVESNDLVTFMTLANLHGDREAHVDSIQYSPDPVESADSDNDGLSDLWEDEHFGNNDGNPTPEELALQDGTGDGYPVADADGLNNEGEETAGTDPNEADSDADGLNDGPEVFATLNDNLTPTGFAATDPTDPDSDDGGAGDGVNDFDEITGALNTQFSNAPTDPNDSDSDDDGMPDAYELANNTPGNALDPNDDGTTDPDQDPVNGDRDGDGLFNRDEYDGTLSGVRTRADLADTDADGYGDEVEDNLGSWFDINATGSDPTNPDTDGDGLLDGQENYDLTSFPGQNVLPTNSDPNFSDTDFDSFIDSYELAQGTNPDDDGSMTTQPTGFTLIEDFESSSGMTLGQTFSGINGWNNFATADSGIVVEEPIEGGDLVGSLTDITGAGSVSVFKSLANLGLQIKEGNTGTLFFQLYTTPGNHDQSLGLSDQLTPAKGDFTAYEAQAATVATLVVRDAAALRATGDYPREEWMNVWIVADNATDTVRVWVESPVGGSGRVEITDDGGVDPFNFRNGTTDPLYTALFNISANGPDGNSVLIDNIYIDPSSNNPTTPAAAKPGPPAPLQITGVSLVDGDLKITFSPGGAGFILTSSNDLASPFTEETNATYDGVNTFTVPAAFLNPGKDFFRVEEP